VFFTTIFFDYGLACNTGFCARKYGWFTWLVVLL